MDDRKALLEAVQTAAAIAGGGDNGGVDDGRQYDLLLALVKRHSTRSDDLNLGEVFQAASKKDHQKIWTAILAVVQPIVDGGRYTPGRYEDNDDDDDDDNRECSEETADHQPDGNTAEEYNAGQEGDDDNGGASPEAPPRPATPDTSSSEKQGEPDAKETSCPRRPTRCRRGTKSSSPGSGGSGAKSSADVALALEVLHAAATLAHEFIMDEARVAPRALLDTAVQLHHVMLSLQGLQGLAVQAVISKVCEMWWIQGRLGGEHLVPQLIPYMLVKSFEDNAKEADVKRMFGLRAALLVLDFDDEDSAPLKILLLRLFTLPLYLKSSEGKRLLVYLFGIHPSMVLDIHEVIKQQLPGAKRSVLATYGEIYFKVWRGVDAEKQSTYLEKIEMHCLQDLMHACIHAATPRMHSNLLIVLDGLHAQKKMKGVDAALLRLYGPVLWRSLRVANPTVRAQACQVLVDAFPLQDPAAGAATYDSVLQQQFDALTTLLEDQHPKVRAVAAKGSCRILSVYWEMVPRDTTRALLARVVGRLACDASSALVRLGAVEGLGNLLECPESHGVLKAMLPGVAKLIHDTDKKVRVAFVHLLDQVKNIRSIKYYHVVSIDNLLARLAEDHLKCPASAAGLSKLVLNSYFPTGAGVTGSIQLFRCLTMLEQDEGAAVAFFSRLHRNAGVPSAAKMLALLVRAALSAAGRSSDNNNNNNGGDGREKDEKDVSDEAPAKGRRKGKRKGEEGEKERPRNNTGSGGTHSMLQASDPKAISAVLNLIATIWESILPALEKTVNEPSLELIQETVTGETLSRLHARFSKSDERCRGAFMRLAGLAGGDLAPEMLEDVVLEMLALPATAPPSVYGPTVDLLCAWGQHEHLMGAAVDSLGTVFAASTGSGTSALTAPSPLPKETRGKRRRPVSDDSGSRGGSGGHGGADDVPGLPPALALSMLSHLLAGGNGNVATTAARDFLMADEEAATNLEDALTLARDMADRRFSISLTSRAGNGSSSSAAVKAAAEEERRCPDALLVRAIEALGRVYMHRQAAAPTGDDDNAGQSRDVPAMEAGDEQLLPMPLSPKMRELMVWTTDMVLPVLGASGDRVDDMAADSTPVKCVPGITAMSPSPMPPPRSRARGDRDKDIKTGGAGTSACAVSNTSASSSAELAERVFGVVVVLASEWVEVGSGLAEVSLRADTWGQMLLSALLRDLEDSRERVGSVLPHLCRLGHQLCVRETQGARPPESLWEVLLRCADCGPSLCVQRLVAAHVALEGRRGGLGPVAERLLQFLFTQASQLDNEQDDAEEEEGEKEGIRRDASSIDNFARLRIRTHGGTSTPANAGGASSDLELSRPGAAVLASISKSGSMSKAAGALALSHLAVFRPADADDAPWPLFCAHILGALLDSAPAQARLELAADAHPALKNVALPSLITRPSGEDDGGDDGDVRDDGAGMASSASTTTNRQAARAIAAIYERLEAARQSALTGGGGSGGGSGEGVRKAAAGSAAEVDSDRENDGEDLVEGGSMVGAAPAVVRVGA